MKKANRLSVLLFSFTLMSLGVMAYSVYGNDTYPYATEVIIGCLAYFFLSILYFILMQAWNTRKLHKYERKERVGTFIKWFAGLSAIHVFVSLLTSSSINGYQLFTSFGLAAGIAFSDMMFQKKRSY
ncbi:hypothetical protein GLW07_16640 [Bacillus hwajinpoensis]|uniref:Permease n=1 Tax=Guptibacillus hwajinpoensis TaxID=208199 RepID=A0A845F2L0_9BACL|nr:hypothetical protein [Pseudalkalibacillus hwajinpoensis]MYL64988.1 hypothetical protein [Pseudalkalibacillus hwajinpoensis]